MPADSLSRHLAVAVAGVVLAADLPARAGPPLVTDDPGAVRPGHLELIASINAIERGPTRGLNASFIDLAWGVAPTLELDLTFGITTTRRGRSGDDYRREGLPLNLGFKWEPLRTDHFSLAIAPSFGLGVEHGDNVAGALPLLTEVRDGRFRAGASFSYVPQDDARDGWLSGIYAGLGIGESELLAEVYTQAFRDWGDPQVNTNLGFDLALSSRLHLLVSAGTGLYGGRGSRQDWASYAGIQWLLGPAPSPPARPKPAATATRTTPGFLGGPRLLELTERQLPRPRRGELLSR